MVTADILGSGATSGRSRSLESAGRHYRRMWSRVPRELGYLALTALIGVIAFNLAAAMTAAGGGLLALLTVLLLAAILLGSRYLGGFELLRLRWAGMPAIAAPVWPRPLQGKHLLRALGELFANGHYWLYGLHSVLLNPLLTAGTFVIWISWIVVAVVASTSPIWGLAPIFRDLIDAAAHPTAASILVGNSSLAQLLIRASEGGSGPVDPARTGWTVAGATAIGLLMIALLPVVTRSMTLAHWSAARLLLGRFPSEALRVDVARADTARRAAITAEDTALRRLERDIHDGPQQRLLRLQMELATAHRRLQDPPAAAESLAAARRLASEALDELRALAQGFAPPLLQDRGLSAALGALGHRGTTPIETAIAITDEVPDAIERSVYFIAAELTANAIKHGNPSRIRLEARTSGSGAGRMLVLAVEDDGGGGAASIPGHGLAGAAERVAGLGGSMRIASPAGGPTRIEIRIPLG